MFDVERLLLRPFVDRKRVGREKASRECHGRNYRYTNALHTAPLEQDEGLNIVR
jgi:hypothetical protein